MWSLTPALLSEHSPNGGQKKEPANKLREKVWQSPTDYEFTPAYPWNEQSTHGKAVTIYTNKIQTKKIWAGHSEELIRKASFLRTMETTSLVRIFKTEPDKLSTCYLAWEVFRKNALRLSRSFQLHPTNCHEGKNLGQLTQYVILRLEEQRQRNPEWAVYVWETWWRRPDLNGVLENGWVGNRSRR